MVDRLHKLFPKKRLSFRFKVDNIGKFDYRMLMSQPLETYDVEMAKDFVYIVSNLKFNKLGNDAFNNYYAVFEGVRKEMSKYKMSEREIVDNLILYLFKDRRNAKKKAFWLIYGDIVYENLKNNLSNNIMICQTCGKRFYKPRSNSRNCPSCIAAKKTRFKEIICVDCGVKFEVSKKANARIRCDDCLSVHKAELNRIRQARFKRKSNAHK